MVAEVQKRVQARYLHFCSSRVAIKSIFCHIRIECITDGRFNLNIVEKCFVVFFPALYNLSFR